jgi:hypothetical protein
MTLTAFHFEQLCYSEATQIIFIMNHIHFHYSCFMWNINGSDNSHITSIFHVVSRNNPETFGFSARHVIDLPSSSVVGTKLRIDFVILLRPSSCQIKKKKERKILFLKRWQIIITRRSLREINKRFIDADCGDVMRKRTLRFDVVGNCK